MFRRILLPVDPSRPFAAANRYAVDLAHMFDSRVVAAYVIDEQLMGSIGGEAAATLDDALEWLGQDAIEDFAAHHPELDVQKALAYGPTATALFQMVLQTGADVVVVGGYHGVLAQQLWGSTVADVVQHVERPAFVVRKEAHLPQAGDLITVPYDGSERPLAELPRIAAFAKKTGAAIELVHVTRGRDQRRSQSILETGMAIIRETGVAASGTMLRASLLRAKWRAIVDHARAIHSPLIALSRLGVSSQRTGRSRTVDSLVAHSPLPVWVVRK